MTIQRMCWLTELSRATFYRLPPHKQRPDPDLELRDAIQRIAVEFPSYGRPRITAELQRRGWVINPKKVYRILREDNLLCLRRRKFVLTTDSGHGLRVYPNLAPRDRPERSGPALGGGYHLYPAGLGVCLSGCDSGCVLAASGRLGARGHAGREADDRRVADGAGSAASRCRAGASLRPRSTVRRQRLCRIVEAARNHPQHEPQSEPPTTMPKRNLS